MVSIRELLNLDYRDHILKSSCMISEIKKTTGHYEELREILGKGYINAVFESPFDFILIATQGVNVNVIENFRKYFSLSLDTSAHLLNISEPVLHTLLKENKDLERNLAIKIFELSELFLTGTEIFSNKENFFKWLELPNTAFGGLRPNELLNVPEGVSKVRDLLGRIEYGVYS